MTELRPAVSRRKWKRFRINGSAVVMLHKPRVIESGKPVPIELGPIIDVSLDGLAVHYIYSEERHTEGFELSISIPNKGIVLKGLPFRIVFQTEVGALPDGRRIIRR